MVRMLLVILILVFRCLFGVDWDYLRYKYGCDLSKYLRSIEKCRMSDVTMIVRYRENHKPVTGALIKIDQISHDFLFGNAPEYLLFHYAPKCYPASRFGEPLDQDLLEKYKTYYLRLFNFATLPAFYWNLYEPRKGELPLRESAIKVAKWLKSNNVIIKGHTLVWGNPELGGIPLWVLKEEFENKGSIWKYLQNRVRREILDFSDLIDMWDVVNEPITHDWFEKIIGRSYISQIYNLVKKVNENTLLLINEYDVLLNKRKRRLYIEKIRDLLENNTPIDIVGVQGNLFLGTSDVKKVISRIDDIFSSLDEIGRLGLPVHITEFQIPLHSIISSFSCSEEEAKKIQADIAVIMYTVFFANPSVEAITYWNLYKAWQKGADLLEKRNNDLVPKPIFYALEDLIHNEWETHIESFTDDEGRITFRGFHGKYIVKINLKNGKKLEFEIHVKKGEKNFFILEVDRRGGGLSCSVDQRSLPFLR